MIGITTRRLTYLNEFIRGLELFNVRSTLEKYKDFLGNLFIKDNSGVINANYVYSLFKPVLSPVETTLHVIENQMLDHLQDVLMMFEDENVSGYSEVLAYDSEETAMKEFFKEEKENIKQEQTAELTPAGVMKWLAGQNHSHFVMKMLTLH